MRKKSIFRVLIVVLILNLFLAIIKLGFGIYDESSALTNDGINSLFDFFLSIMLLFTIKLSHKSPDKNHPYGHEKYEAILSLIFSLLIVGTGLALLIGVFLKLLNNQTSSRPTMISLIIAIISVLIKLFLYIYTKRSSIKYSQASLKADAVNHFADAIATFVVIVGIIISIIGLPIFDNIASVIIALVIMYQGVKLFIEATSWIVDEAPSKDVYLKIRHYILSCKGVLDVDDLKIRMHVTNLYVDLEIKVDRNLTLIEAHKIAEKVHIGVENNFKKVIHCMVHVNPN